MTRPFSLALIVVAALLVPTAAESAKKEKGQHCTDGIDNDNDGLIDDEDPDCGGGGGAGAGSTWYVRARFGANHADGSPTAIQGDVVTCTDADGDWQYSHPDDAGCYTAYPIRRSHISPDGFWWLAFYGDEVTGQIDVNRWAQVLFPTPVPGSVNSQYVNSTENGGEVDPDCPDVDVLIFGDGVINKYTYDGGIPVRHYGPPSDDAAGCTGSVDRNVIFIQTEDNVDPFELPDGEIRFQRFWIATEPSGPNKNGSSRYWVPRFWLNYYDPWEKVTEDPDNPDIIVLRSHSTGDTSCDPECDHRAELREEGIRGPASKSIVGDYVMPAEIVLKRVSATSP